MFILKRAFICLIFLIFFVINDISAGVEVKKWEPFDIRFEAKNKYENPYIATFPDKGEPLVKIRVTGTSGDAQGKEYVLKGFWDGGDYWRVRFAAPETGDWRYISISSDPGMNGKTGEITCTDWTEEEKLENPTRRGLIYVSKQNKRAGRYFVYADGTPFLWVGDIWSYWTKKGVSFTYFEELVKDRVKKGFTLGQYRFAFNGRGYPLDRSYDNLDITEMRRIDGMISYANSKGMSVWILHWWGGKYVSQIEVEKVRRWCRYLIARFATYNVVWVVAGEYNLYNYGGVGIDYWKDLGDFIGKEDPYQRITGIHHTPPTWSGGEEAPMRSSGEYLHNEPWFDYSQIQSGHGRWKNELIPSVVAADYARIPPKPTVVTEPWIEFVKRSTPAQNIRFGGWSAMLSGAAGHCYGGGGIWMANVPESARSPFSYDIEWFHETLNYPGGNQIGYMSKFLKNIQWWKLEPHPELITEYPEPYCSAVLGKEYVAYLRYGGPAQLNLKDAEPNSKFIVKWYNPRIGKYEKTEIISGGDIVRVFAPDRNDWVMYAALESSE